MKNERVTMRRGHTVVANIHADETTRLRLVDPAKVEELAASIEELGLLNPVVVRPRDPGRDPNGCAYVLVSGAHRLAAVKRLGWEKVTVSLLEDPEGRPMADAAQLVEIVENLHRNELSPAERDAHIRRYAGLMEVVGQLANNSPGPKGGRPESIATRVSNATGIPARSVRRALQQRTGSAPKAPREPSVNEVANRLLGYSPEFQAKLLKHLRNRAPYTGREHFDWH